MSKEIRVKIDDPNDEGTQKFLNLLDPILWSVFINKVKDMDNTKTIYDLFDELVEGR